MVTEIKTRKTVPLCGGAKAHIDLFTGEGLVTFTDLVDEEMGIEVSHIIAPGLSGSDNDYCCGKGTRLNLHEHFVKNEDETVDADYIYTDSMGDRYLFKEYFNYVGFDEQKHRISDKSQVVATDDGTLTYSDGTNTYIVEREISTNEGMKASAKLEGINNVESYDNSNKQLEELKDKRDSYAESIANFAFYNTETKEIHETGSKHEELMEFKSIVEAGNGCVVMNNDVISLKEKVDSLRNNRLSLQLQQKLLNNQNQDVAERRQLIYDLSYLNWRSYLYLKSIVNDETGDIYLKIKSEQEMAQYGVYNSSGNPVGAIGNYADYSDIRDANGFVFSRSDLLTFKSCMRSQTAAITYQTESGETATYTQETSILNQIASVDAQIEALLSGNDETTKQLELYFKQYAEANKEYEKNKLQMPINFVMSNSGVKGFNESGELVVVYGKMGNYVAIEYEPYFVGNEMKHRIARLYDDKERYICLLYNTETNLLNEINNRNGKKVRFTYVNGKIGKVTFPNETEYRATFLSKVMTLAYETNYKAELTTTDGKLTSVVSYSNLSSVSYSGATLNSAGFIEAYRTDIEYSADESIKKAILTDENNMRQIYVFDLDSKRLVNRFEERNGVVTSAEKYVFSEEDGSKYHETYSLNKKDLYVGTYNTVDFETATNKSYSLKEYDQRGKLVKSNSDTYDGGMRKETVVLYIYTVDDKLKKKQTTVLVNEVDEITYIEFFEYNSLGSVARKQSYVVGEKTKNGIDIEEHVYDKNGNEIRTVKYNSLDPSSKLYTETEYDENGKAVCQLDALGENKTYFEYENGSSTVLSETYPNGSKLSYGYSKIDGNTAISMSNEEGEENSIQVLRTKGLATKVISGDNVYEYTYDCKGRVTKVSLNGVELMAEVYTDGETELQSVITEKGETVTTVTDLDGKVKSVVRSTGGSEKSITNSYNSKDMLLSTVDNANNISITTA
ncbi:MAG: hypothetical protein IJX02_08075, partial [Clostridia bacterium]|nr:hypothetical protein [Clostridia bacterium]